MRSGFLTVSHKNDEVVGISAFLSENIARQQSVDLKERLFKDVPIQPDTKVDISEEGEEGVFPEEVLVTIETLDSEFVQAIIFISDEDMDSHISIREGRAKKVNENERQNNKKLSEISITKYKASMNSEIK